MQKIFFLGILAIVTFIGFGTLSMGQAYMFEKFTEKAKRVLFFARYEASQFGSPYIETEHILLGLLREDKNLPNRFLPHPILSLDSVRKDVKDRAPKREKVAPRIDLPFSKESIHVLNFANEESEHFSHAHIGTEHILLGLLREEQSLAAEILKQKGLELSLVRKGLTDTTTTKGYSPEAESAVAAIIPEAPAATISKEHGSFTEKAKRVLFFARYEASQMGDSSIESYHLLLGLIREDRPAILDTLPDLKSGNLMEVVRRKIQEKIGVRQPGPTTGLDFPMSPEVQRILQRSINTARVLTQPYVDTKHLLLSLLWEAPSIAAQVLSELGLDLNKISVLSLTDEDREFLRQLKISCSDLQ